MSKYLLSVVRRKELKMAFDEFDKKKTGVLNFNRLHCLLKSIGVDASRRDFKALKLEHQDRGDFTFDDLLLIGEQVYNDRVMENRVLLALRELDPKKTGKVSTRVLRDTLLRLGNYIFLTEEEVDAFLNIECDGKRHGQVDYETFIYRLLRD